MKCNALIDRIIATESLKSYLAYNPRNADGTPKYKKHRPYTLNAAALEALEIKKAYNAGEINKEEFKAYCLKYSLTYRREPHSPAMLKIMNEAERKAGKKIYMY